MRGKIVGPGNYERPEGWSGVAIGEGEIVEVGNQIITAAEALEKIIGQLDSAIESAEKELGPEQVATSEKTVIDVLPGFPEKVQGEILFLDADNISTDGIYPGMYCPLIPLCCLASLLASNGMSPGALAYGSVPKHSCRALAKHK